MYHGLKIKITGRVQGVGFRPFIYSLAKKYEITGTVQNHLGCVRLIVQGKTESLVDMVEEIKNSPPLLAKIDEVEVQPINSSSHYKDFTIIPSEEHGDTFPWIPSDAAICIDCLEELKDPHNIRYDYPFINCTQCGPRYTIIENLPYDRPNTTMKEFNLCPICKVEYENPLNRRHHAQPICCPSCGPTVTLLNKLGESISEDTEAIFHAAQLLKQGKIIAIKGVGGFHLACDAYQESTIKQLRIRKNRPQRPLAVMAKSIDMVRKNFNLSKSEEEILRSPEMPIILLQKKIHCTLPEILSPGLTSFGLMLPYTPLHYLLFQEDELDYLVMTSANSSGHPIIYNEEDLGHLLDISDYVLTHNRKIHRPVDDSVIQFDGEKMMQIRRARGFVPEPIKTSANVDRVIALGGNQKSTFAIGWRNQIVISPHIGDLDNEEMIQHYDDQLTKYKRWLGVNEKYIAIDKHPFYATNHIANKLNGTIIPVQHHHAHHVSCMEDNGLVDPCLGIILDGTGYGDDNNIWGFEFLYGNAKSFERLGHLKYTPLPGGEKAVREPWRNAVGMIMYYFPDEGKNLSMKLFPEKKYEISIMEQMIKNDVNSPMAGTCGRLFDAVSAILGICTYASFEGEAAMKLSDYINRKDCESVGMKYQFKVEKMEGSQFRLDFSSMIYQIIQDKLNNKTIADIIQSFHATIVESCIEMVKAIAENRPNLNKNIVLSGGSFQNIYLAQKIKSSLQEEGFHVYTHNKVPCNDGGLSLGQMIVASQIIEK